MRRIESYDNAVLADAHIRANLRRLDNAVFTDVHILAKILGKKRKPREPTRCRRQLLCRRPNDRSCADHGLSITLLSMELAQKYILSNSDFSQIAANNTLGLNDGLLVSERVSPATHHAIEHNVLHAAQNRLSADFVACFLGK